MPDPISIASAVALAGQVVSKCYAYGCAVSDGPKEIKSLVEEVTNLSGLLLGLQGLLNAERIVSSQKEAIQRSLEECQATLRDIDRALEYAHGNPKKSKISQTVKKFLWPLQREQTLRIVERLARQREILALALSTDTASEVHGIQVILADVQLNLERDRIEQRAREAAVNKQKVLQWLCAVDYEAKHTIASDLQHPGTGSWVLESVELRRWVDGDTRFLWLNGIPGSGKTVWTGIILNHCVLPALSENLAAAYFYCDFRDTASERPESVLGALIAQLCKQIVPFPEEVEETLQRHSSMSGKITSASFQELKRLLNNVLSLCPSAMLIIDALDECVERTELLDLIVELSINPSSKVKILVTSRRDIDIQRAFQKLPQLSLQSRAADYEIRQLVLSTINVHPKFQLLAEGLKGHIISSLSEGAGGMYRWVRCQLDELTRLRTPKAMRQAVKTLPRDLNETYERILVRIEGHDRILARRALLWLAFSARPLKLKEIAEISVFEPTCRRLDPEDRLSDPEDILAICGSLVSLTSRSEVVLAHNSVRDYLLGDECARSASFFYLQEDQSHIEIATVCIRYLFLENFRNGPTLQGHTTTKRIDDFPLFQYATHNWCDHAREFLTKDSDLWGLACSLLAPTLPPHFYAWVQGLLVHPSVIQRTFARWPPNATPLYYAASFGLVSVVEYLIDAGVDIDFRGGAMGGTALHAACWRCHPGVVKVLLNAGVDLEVRDNQGMVAGELAEITADPEIRRLFRTIGGVTLADDNKLRLLWRPKVVR